MAPRKIICALAFLLFIFPSAVLGAQEEEQSSQEEGRLIKVVALSRHGVRAPTQSESTLALWSRKPWPTWPVARGELTGRGFHLVRAQWQNLRGHFIANGLLGDEQCPAKDDIYVRSDTDERDQATSQAILDGLGSNCGYQYAVSDDKIDPLFHPVKAGLYRFDPITVATDVQMMTNGGFDHLQEILGGSINLLDKISGSPAPELCKRYSLVPNCQFSEIPNAVSVSPEGNDIRIMGGLGIASSMAEIFLLEYAQWPGEAAGWGQVDATVLGQILPVHSHIFDVVNRAPVVAWARGSGLLREISDALIEKHGDSRVNSAKIVVFVGHDTNIANIGALLGIRWHASGYPLNGIPPGAVLVFELWDKDGVKEVRVKFYAQQPKALHAAFTGKPDEEAVSADEFAPNSARVWAPPIMEQAKYEVEVFDALVKKATADAPIAPAVSPAMRNFESIPQ